VGKTTPIRPKPNPALELHEKWREDWQCANLKLMKKLIGIVQTENPADANTIVFSLLLDNGRLVACRSGAGYKSAKPKKGDTVAIIGDTIRDIITGGDSIEFFYNSLEILTLTT
jgi:hypothetical protein